MQFYIFGGGTVSHVRPHFALCAPAYGGTARRIKRIIERNHYDPARDYMMAGCLTKMADPNSSIETNADVLRAVEMIVNDEGHFTTRGPPVIFFSVAMCDFEGEVTGDMVGDPNQRLKTSEGMQTVALTPAAKVIGKIREKRKDIFLVGFKTTTGADERAMFKAGLNLLKTASCNLVLVNDLTTKRNMIVTPEVAPYDGPNPFDRQLILEELVAMTVARAGLSFTRTNVVDEEHLMPWREAPQALQKVVDYCASQGAYKPFNGVTVGHFGYCDRPLSQSKDRVLGFWSSRRKKDFNNEEDRDLVMVHVFGPGSHVEGQVVAYGHKPSAGARSQAKVFENHEGYDCVVHFHCHPRDPMLPPNEGLDGVPHRAQRNLECGSHECGQNTSDGMKEFPEYGVKAVMLEKHGPNILFRSDGDPDKVIEFIKRNFNFDANTSQYL